MIDTEEETGREVKVSGSLNVSDPTGLCPEVLNTAGWIFRQTTLFWSELAVPLISQLLEIG